MAQTNANNLNINNLGGASEFQAVVRSMMSAVNTGELVRVVAVNNDGVSPVGFVSVKPLVYKVDGDNNNIERAVIHNVPYFRLQGGKNAIIIDPQVGDIGFCGVSARDTTLVKRIRSYAPPNMRRNSDISDAVYIGGMLNGTPEQYVWFKEDEIVIKSTSKVTIDAPLSHFTGNVTADGTIQDLASSNGVTMDSMRTTYNNHNHGGVQTGGGSTQQPNSPME